MTVEPGPDVPIIRTSALATFQQCRRRFHYQWIKGYVPARPPKPLVLGNIVHAGLAGLFHELQDECGQTNTLQDLTPTTIAHAQALGINALEVEIDRYCERCNDADALEDNDTELCYAMYRSYCHEGLPFILNSHSTVWCVEQSLDTIIDEDNVRAVLRGTFDLVLRGSAGFTVVDHKTTSSFRDAGSLYLDAQMTAYAFIMVRHTSRIPNILYSQIRKKIPSVPEVLKDGTRLSRKACDTNYDVLLSTIRAHGFDPTDYTAELAKAQANQFVRFDYVQRTKAALRHYEQSLVAQLRDLLECRCFYPSPSRLCIGHCPYTGACATYLESGSDDAYAELTYDIDPAFCIQALQDRDL